MRLLLTILAELAIDLVTGKLERAYRADKLRADLRGDSRRWAEFTRKAGEQVTPKAPPSSRR